MEAPEYWGHLRVLEQIGRGAFGHVYRAWDTRLEREVALKLLPASTANSDSRATSIIEEGRLLARVQHPNVVTIYGAEQIGTRIALWMELVRGRTLQQMLRQGKSFTPVEVVSIGTELCQAIQAVHAAGLLHRDIKPHNVILADDGRIFLMDFGTGLEAAAWGAAETGTVDGCSPRRRAGTSPARDATPSRAVAPQIQATIGFTIACSPSVCWSVFALTIDRYRSSRQLLRTAGVPTGSRWFG